MAETETKRTSAPRAWSRATRFLESRGDRWNSVRRHAEMLVDQAWTLGRHRLSPPVPQPPFDGNARFGLITVNFSTTRLLKMMLLTLSEQESLSRLSRVIIVDNDCRDGGQPFLRELSQRLPRLHWVEQRRFPTHARGLRKGVRVLDEVELSLPENERSNVLLPCDTDVIFRNPQTLETLATIFERGDVAFAGELRTGLYPYPEAQASFFALRRDIYARADVAPFVHHGAPAYFMQRSLHRAGLHLEDFPSNFGGYILHRGRSGVAASRTYRPHDAHATAATYHPHYMGVPGGAAIWAAAEARLSPLLESRNETELLDTLESRLSSMGR